MGAQIVIRSIGFLRDIEGKRGAIKRVWFENGQIEDEGTTVELGPYLGAHFCELTGTANLPGAIEPHTHRGMIETFDIFGIEGEAWFYDPDYSDEDDTDDHWRVLQQGDLIIVPAGVEHGFRVVGKLEMRVDAVRIEWPSDDTEPWLP